MLVFSTIKFYGVPAGHMSAGTLQRKRWVPGAANPLMLLPPHCHGFLSYFTLHTPSPNPQNNGMAPQELHVLWLCPVREYFTFFAPFCLMQWRQLSFWAGNLQAWRCKTKMVILSFQGGREGSSIAMHQPTFSAQTWTWSTLYPSQVKMQARYRVLPLLRL